MIRQSYSGANGWTSIKDNTHNSRLRHVINTNIAEFPVVFDTSSEHQSFAVGLKSDDIVHFHILTDVNTREDENCMRSEHLHKVWNFREFWIWEVTCEYGESFGDTMFYKQPKDCNEAISKIDLKVLWDKGNLVKLYDVNAYGCLLRDINYVGKMVQTTLVFHISSETVNFKFVQDAKIDRVQDRVAPRAVNICYTGSLKGQITAETLDMITRKKIGSRRGPCGSEIHIDTAMGVVQIFGNNNSYRQITCKAFVSKKQADSVIDYLCQMV
jgi:hypothetical protein